ncbi:hypothetical protein BZA70DRAFT_142910 [Myxozyma melibiosi]|uniref:G-patch domain-containing protein n=1 Tax=Myxozyma melibiosi TaxID=54550 RepID=A0ABR1F7J8_9ASCO
MSVNDKANAPGRRAPGLYDSLEAAVVASKDPVAYSREPTQLTEEDEKQKMLAAALKFQPIHARSGKTTAAPAGTVISKPPTLINPSAIPRPHSKVTIDSFTDNNNNRAESGQEQSRPRRTGYYNRRKKQRLEDAEKGKLDWEDTYDPMRPNQYEEYKKSEEKFMEDEDWRSYLLDLKARREGADQDRPEAESSQEEEEEQQLEERRSFAPPTTYDDPASDSTGVTVSKAPVMYQPPDPSPPPHSPPSPPGPRQKSAKETFARRLLSKYGWTPGTGLGASSTGITKALRFSADNKKAGHGRIVDKNEKRDDEGRFGKMSKVVVLREVVDADEADEELAGEIGTECDAKYGTVERVYVNEGGAPRVDVYVRFTSELSALRAVNGLDGRLFSGTNIVARFYDEYEFEQGKLLGPTDDKNSG